MQAAPEAAFLFLKRNLAAFIRAAKGKCFLILFINHRIYQHLNADCTARRLPFAGKDIWATSGIYRIG